MPTRNTEMPSRPLDPVFCHTCTKIIFLNLIQNRGVSLADLTHIDENEDFVIPKDKKPAPEGMKYINFTKQYLTFTAIDKLTKYQTSADFSSTIARAEPLFTFLYSLPKLGTFTVNQHVLITLR